MTRYGTELLETVNAGITQAMTQLGQRLELAELRWSLRRDLQGAWGVDGHVSVGDYAAEECLRLAEQWATALGLEINPLAVDGTIEYIGLADGLRVVVWAVVDRYEFEEGRQ